MSRQELITALVNLMESGDFIPDWDARSYAEELTNTHISDSEWRQIRKEVHQAYDNL